MTQLMEQALNEIAKLPNEEQDALARQWLEELKAARDWEVEFPAEADDWDTMAAQAIADDDAGRTRPLEELLDSVQDEPRVPQAI